MAVALCAAMVFPTCMTAVIINMRKQYNENGLMEILKVNQEFIDCFQAVAEQNGKA